MCMLCARSSLCVQFVKPWQRNHKIIIIIIIIIIMTENQQI